MNNNNTELSNVIRERTDHGFLHDLLGGLKTSIIATIVLALIVSGVYPLIVWGLAQALFHDKANGSLIDKNGNPVTDDKLAIGSALLGQSFSDGKYFHPRPSTAGNGYDATSSGGSNLGPTSAKLLFGTLKKDDKGNDIVDFDGIADRVIHYCEENHISYTCSVNPSEFHDKDAINDVKLIRAFNASDKAPIITPKEMQIPADAVTASASGLDPHISVANAQIQAPRVATARKMSVEKVKEMIARYTEGPSLGIFGDAGVNVLRLNVALDQISIQTATASSDVADHRRD